MPDPPDDPIVVSRAMVERVIADLDRALDLGELIRGEQTNIRAALVALSEILAIGADDVAAASGDPPSTAPTPDTSPGAPPSTSP